LDRLPLLTIGAGTAQGKVSGGLPAQRTLNQIQIVQSQTEIETTAQGTNTEQGGAPGGFDLAVGRQSVRQIVPGGDGYEGVNTGVALAGKNLYCAAVAFADGRNQWVAVCGR